MIIEGSEFYQHINRKSTYIQFLIKSVKKDSLEHSLFYWMKYLCIHHSLIAFDWVNCRGKGLCMFCDDTFVLGHQLKHKRT